MVIESAVIPVDLVLIIATATVLSFIAKKTGQPSIVAYIFTGLLLGPVFFDIISQSTLTKTISELGLGFLLFLIGIELDFGKIKNIFKPVVRIALGQTVLQTGLAFAVSYMLGFSLIETTILALSTVFGATPVVVKILSDKDQISTLPGKIDVGVLIIQDIILVITLTLLSAESLSNINDIAFSLGKILLVASFVSMVSIASSRYLLPEIFKKLADQKDALLLYSLSWAFVFISLSDYLGLSIEVGAFLAGMSLGQLPYSNELKERIRPLTDFFIMVFFSSIGLTLDRSGLLVYWKEALIASGILMAGNFLIMFYLIDREKFTPETSFLGSINMIQVSEFSLVVGALAVSKGYISTDIVGYLSLMAIVTMSVSAYIINYNKEIYTRIKPLLQRFESDTKTDVDVKQLENHAVLIGFDSITRHIAPVLDRYFEQILVIDNNPTNIDELARSDYEYIHGDFRHSELRNSASLDKASLVVSVAPDHDVSKEILQSIGHNTTAFLKADDIERAGELYEMGASYVIVRNVLTGEKMAEYIKLFLEDEELFEKEVETDIYKITYGGRRNVRNN